MCSTFSIFSSNFIPNCDCSSKIGLYNSGLTGICNPGESLTFPLNFKLSTLLVIFHFRTVSNSNSLMKNDVCLMCTSRTSRTAIATGSETVRAIAVSPWGSPYTIKVELHQKYFSKVEWLAQSKKSREFCDVYLRYSRFLSLGYSATKVCRIKTMSISPGAYLIRFNIASQSASKAVVMWAAICLKHSKKTHALYFVFLEFFGVQYD